MQTRKKINNLNAGRCYVKHLDGFKKAQKSTVEECVLDEEKFEEK